MVLSTMLATVGLYLNSASVIIGAMLLAPLMTPIVSLSMGILRGNIQAGIDQPQRQVDGSLGLTGDHVRDADAQFGARQRQGLPAAAVPAEGVGDGPRAPLAAASAGNPIS